LTKKANHNTLKKNYIILQKRMEKIKAVLKKVGLSQNEIDVYLTSLSIWQSTASIIWQKIWLNRSTSRYTCQSLVSKRIMSMIPKKDYFLFSAEDPEKLLTILNKEYSLIDNKVRDLQQIMWDLKWLVNPQASIPKIKYFQWVDGIIDLLEDVFIENKPICWFLELPEDIHPEIIKYTRTIYIEKRIKSWIKAKMLFNNNEKTLNYRKLDEKMYRESLIVPTNLYPFDCCIHIYGNKVAFYSYKEHDLTGVLIENEYIKQSTLSMFKMSWDLAKGLPENNKK